MEKAFCNLLRVSELVDLRLDNQSFHPTNGFRSMRLGLTSARTIRTRSRKNVISLALAACEPGRRYKASPLVARRLARSRRGRDCQEQSTEGSGPKRCSARRTISASGTA